MDDPGSFAQDEMVDDWKFESEQGEWRNLLVGGHRMDCGAREGERQLEAGDNGGKGRKKEANGYKKEVEREMVRRRGGKGDRSAVAAEIEEKKAQSWQVLTTTALTRNKAQLFPTTRRPEKRDLIPEEQVSSKEIEEWFSSTALTLGTSLTGEEKDRARRLLYTWRDIFETDLLRIRKTDLIEHAIILEPGAKPYRARIPLYTEEEINFCKRLLPKMEEAGLIFRCDSEWGARTKFPLKPRADTLPKESRLRMVHNFIPLNRVTEKSCYPCPRIEQIVYTVLKKGKRYFFTTDAANSYWAIPVRPGDQTKLGFVTPYGMYCYNVMGQGLTGGTHTYSRFRDLVFGAIPEGFCNENGIKKFLAGSESLIGDSGEIAFDGMIDDSYGSATTFEAMFQFLHTQFFPRCSWGPMYLKDSKSCFFSESLQFVGLEAGPNGLRPSLRKRETILQWPIPTSQEEVEAFCYLTPFLRRFIPGRAELVRIMKYGKESMYGKVTTDRRQRRNAFAGEFKWDDERNTAFEAMKQAIANNAMAPPDPLAQYHLAVDASKQGIGGVLFQLAGIEHGTEATNTDKHRTAERIIMFISFRLAEVESRYSNSEREALAVIRCLAEVRWMIIASPFPIFVYTDHEALKTLLTGPDNDAHGRIAKWQERLGEYDIRLLHRPAKTHFMAIADGLSRLPTRLLKSHVAEDVEGCRPRVGVLIPVYGQVMDTMVNGALAIGLRCDGRFWKRLGIGERQEAEEGERLEGGENSGRVEFLSEGMVQRDYGDEGGRVSEGLVAAARDMRWRRWRKWLESGMYGAIVRARLEEWEGGSIGGKTLEMGRSQRRAFEKTIRRYILVDGAEPRLFFREKNGELATCILEGEVKATLNQLHEGHGHFAARITLGRAHGKVYWPSRAFDIGRWTSSCEPCQRVSRIQKAGEIRSIIQFKPMDMIGMDYVGPINPPCASTGYVYILLVIDYFSRFLWAVGVKKADQISTMRALLDNVFPVVGWPLTVYTDNGSHFTGSMITRMWIDHGVIHFASAISHPQSVGLSERYVQMLMGRIRLACISLGSSANWGMEIRNAVLAINTRFVRLHGYTPAEILLGFNPSTTRKIEAGMEDWAKRELLERTEAQEITESNVDSFIDLRYEKGIEAGNRLAGKQDSIHPRPSAGYRKPKPGDLVLVRDFQQAKEKGRKLEPRWSTPRIVDRISASGVSAHVRQLHDPPELTKRFHIDDLILYVPRTNDYPHHEGEISEIGNPGVEYIRGAMGDTVGGGQVGQRGFDITDVDSLAVT